MFINKKAFRPEWINEKFPWGSGTDWLLGYNMRKNGWHVIVDRGVSYHHFGGSSHTAYEWNQRNTEWERFFKQYGSKKKEFYDCQVTGNPR
jgi:hypothetical protein